MVVYNDLDGALDGPGVASDGSAVTIQHFAFMAKCFDAATGKIPDIGVLCHYAQCQLLSAAADDERRDTIEGGSG